VDSVGVVEIAVAEEAVEVDSEEVVVEIVDSVEDAEVVAEVDSEDVLVLLLVDEEDSVEDAEVAVEVDSEEAVEETVEEEDDDSKCTMPAWMRLTTQDEEWIIKNSDRKVTEFFVQSRGLDAF